MNHGAQEKRRRRATDFGLRLAGLALSGVAALSFRALTPLQNSVEAYGAPAFLLAAIGFLGASAAAGLLVFGRRIFDQVPVSERWARNAATGAGSSDRHMMSWPNAAERQAR